MSVITALCRYAEYSGQEMFYNYLPKLLKVLHPETNQDKLYRVLLSLSRDRGKRAFSLGALVHHRRAVPGSCFAMQLGGIGVMEARGLYSAGQGGVLVRALLQVSVG